ncbi:MAG: HNH endonuclease [Treponema sp.]|nr:HNH endonuclease [Treponema sp.]
MKEFSEKKYEIVNNLQERNKYFEYWKQIENLNYEVSTEGRIRKIVPKRIIKAGLSGRKRDEYYVQLETDKGFRSFQVSKLVLKAFTKEPKTIYKVVHIDGNKENNCLFNLDYKEEVSCEDFLTFKDIPDFPNYMINKKGDILNKNLNRILKKAYDKDGYVKTTLSVKNQSSYYRVHRLVALTFIPNPNNLPFVNHINGIKDDNRVENLEWCTARENSLHASKTGLQPRKEKRKNAKLKEEWIPWIKKMREVGISYKQIGDVYNVNSKTILSVIKNESWM